MDGRGEMMQLYFEVINTELNSHPIWFSTYSSIVFFLINQHDTQVLYFRVFCCVSLNKKNESAQITYISSTTIR